MEAADLGRWTRFAAKGGIGKCTALCDCVAEDVDDLMFLKDDEIIVLMQLNDRPGAYLGYCEGIVGRFQGSNVRFHSKLKKPVMAKRSSVTAASLSPSRTGKSPTPSYGTKSPILLKGDSPVPLSRRTRISFDEQVAPSLSSVVPSASTSNTSSEIVPITDPVLLRLNKSRTSFSSKMSSDGYDRNDGEAKAAPGLSPSVTVAAAAPVFPLQAPFEAVPTLPQDSPPDAKSSTQSRGSLLSSRHTSAISAYSQNTASEEDEHSQQAGTSSVVDPSTLSPSGIPAISTSTTTSPPTSPPLITPNPALTNTAAATSSLVPDTSTSTFFEDPRISLALSDGEVGIGLTLLQNMANDDGYGGWSDSDSDGQAIDHKHKGNGRKGSVKRRGSSRSPMQRASGIGRVDSGAWRRGVRASVLTEGSRYSSDGSTVERLGYDDDTELGHGQEADEEAHGDVEDELEADITQTQAAFKHLDELASRRSSSLPLPRRDSSPPNFPPVEPLSPGRSRFIPPSVSTTAGLGITERTQHHLSPARGKGYEMEFPTPPSHTPQLPLPGLRNSTTISPIPALSTTTTRPSPAHTHNPSASTTNSHSSTPSIPVHAATNPSRSSSLNIAVATNFSSDSLNDEQWARRPSLAPSSLSSDWEGAAAADIYDDYRYSRFSIGSKVTTNARGSITSSLRRTSVSSSRAGTGTGQNEWPPLSEDMIVRARTDSGSVSGSARPSFDVTKSEGGRELQATGGEPASMPASVSTSPQQPHQRVAYVIGPPRTRSRSNTTASINLPSFNPVPPLSPPPAIVQSSPSRHPPAPQTAVVPLSPPQPQKQLPPSDLQRQIDIIESSIPTSMGQHRKIESSGGSESDDSMYTQSSMGKPSLHIDSGSFGDNNGTAPVSHLGLATSDSKEGGSWSGRPTPLVLASSNMTPLAPGLPNGAQPSMEEKHRSPLLHTSWASPISSPASSAQFATIPSLIPGTLGVNDNTFNTPNTGSSFGNLGVMPPSGPSSSASNTEFKIAGASGDPHDDTATSGGMASAFRQRFEFERKNSTAESVVQVHVPEVDENEGIGRRIVVEDEDEEDMTTGRSKKNNAVDEFEGRDTNNALIEPDISFGSRSQTFLHESPLSSPVESIPDIPYFPTSSTDPSPREVGGNDTMVKKEVGSQSTSSLVSHSPTIPTSTPSLPPTTHTSVAPSTTPSPAPPHLRPRPTLNELRGLQPGEDSSQRQSLFLPHPNAPKAPSGNSSGPMYIQQHQSSSPQPHARGGAIQTIRLALSGQGPQRGPRGYGPTIYGITNTDLNLSMGPVLVQFTVDPPLATAPPRSRSVLPSAIIAPVPTTPVRRIGSLASLDSTLNTGTKIVGHDVERPSSGASGVIPRANFLPKVGTARPRSRSFSAFQTTAVSSRSREDPSSPLFPIGDVKRSLSPIIQSPTGPSISSNNNIASQRSSPLRTAQPPHPLEPPTRSIRAPPSPLAQSFSSTQTYPVLPSPTHPNMDHSPSPQLKQAVSRSTLNESPTTRPTMRSRTVGYTSDAPSPSQPLMNSPPELRKERSIDADSSSIYSTRSNIVSPTPALGHRTSIRSKLSLPNLRKTLGKQDDTNVIAAVDAPSLVAPDAGDTLQVEDMDFELVRPNIPHINGPRSSEDSGVMGRDMSVDARQDTAFLRADTPNSPKSPTMVSDGGSTSGSGLRQFKGPAAGSSGRGTDSESSMDAHRHRELKWMSVISSVPPSQSRKNKKVKKLLFDGVPSSVRYLVWSHLTDGKARSVPGVYTQLCARERVPVFSDIERDIQICFNDHPQFRSTRAPMTLLQAYLSMVPDIQYSAGLTLIAGQLLLLAPEEDAFWIFVSIMDTHIRPYFSTTSTQIEVDASLFQRSLEAVDPHMAKRIFVDLSIPPISICRPWFMSLFVGSLPSEYLNRVWDIFLFEGVPFLFRVALVLVSSCRKQISEAMSEQAALNALLRPHISQLPSSPEALVTLALAVKMKDDDLRKQRLKLEAQSKRQTQAPRTTGAISLPRI